LRDAETRFTKMKGEKDALQIRLEAKSASAPTNSSLIMVLDGNIC
jgi:hypothetical protein